MRLRRLSLLLFTLAASALVGGTAFSSPSEGTFSAFAMRPLPGNVYTEHPSWSLPFASANGFSEANPSAGTGCSFSYRTWFTMDQKGSLYDGMPVPTPAIDVKPFTMNGQVVVRDRTGSRVLEVANINRSGVQQNVFTMFADGNRVLTYEKRTNTGREIPLAYSQPTPAGIEAFLKAVKIHGIVRDNSQNGDYAMSDLLDACGARQVGTDRIGNDYKGRQLVYGIPASPYDQTLAYDYLKIWVRVGDFKIVRTELAMPWGNERTDYSNIIDGVRFDDTMFLLENETIDQLPQF